MHPFFRLDEAFLGGSDRLEILVQLVLIAFGEPRLQVARFPQHVVENAFAATDLAEDLGFVGRAVLRKELGESVADVLLRRHQAAAVGPAKVVGPGAQCKRVKAGVLAERGGDVLIERTAVPFGRRRAGKDARLGGMATADARMFETGDDCESITQIGQRRKVLRDFVCGSGLLRNE